VTNIELTGAESMLSPEVNLVVLSGVGLVALVLYLNRAATLEKLLPPAFAALGLIVTMGLAGTVLNLSLVILAAILAFVGSGVYLAIQGEFRAGLRALAKRDNRLARIQEKRERMEAFIATSSTVEQGGVVLAAESIPDLEDSDQEDTRTTLRLIDTELLDLAEKQRKRSKNWSTSGRHDLEIGDIHHQPVITLMFLITTILATTVISFMTGATLLALGFGVMLSLMFVGAARLRANEIGLRLPDIMGIEAPNRCGNGWTRVDPCRWKGFKFCG
jgi:hypothetical protein